MDQLTKSIHAVYDNREKYIIIGLTGRTGTGCSTTASILETNEKDLHLSVPQIIAGNKNEERKTSIVKRFLKLNWEPFKKIEIKVIITSYILDSTKDNFIKFISHQIEPDDVEQQNRVKDKFLKEFGGKFDEMKIKYSQLDFDSKEEEDAKKIIDFFLIDCGLFSNSLKNYLDSISKKSYIKLFQIFGDNIRSSGCAISSKYSAENIFAISKRVNLLIKKFRQIAKKDPSSQTYIVIDSLRNPFEALYFRERYSAFYLMGINTTDEDRAEYIKVKKLNPDEIIDLDKKESNKEGGTYSNFVSQNIPKCYDLADIHVYNKRLGHSDLTFLKWQITKFVALIMHPGIIVPTSVERCMQIAHTAKLNSGCLSRQVGACVTDAFYSIKGIGWNTPPEGQTPCSLRNVFDLINNEDREAFSEYEWDDSKFRKRANDLYRNETTLKNIVDLKGRNVAYCFKDIQNDVENKDNQVHTRALHAEENAFLQIVKYGGQGIKGGKLFTTSSPCVLCAKKAYQLGIKEIYFIDSYPDISESHVLHAGTNSPSLSMFSGAIGRAYHQLYEPILPIKDEINYITKVKTKSYVKDLENQVDTLKMRIEELEKMNHT